MTDCEKNLPELVNPAVLIEQLLSQARRERSTAEVVYLDSDKPDHRWGSDSFHDLSEEFRFKTIWVAKRLREVLGSPDAMAFVQALHRFEPGLAAAAWWTQGRIAFVSLRQSFDCYGSAVGRQRLAIVLGVTEPAPDESGPAGDEARVAAGIVSTLIH